MTRWSPCNWKGTRLGFEHLPPAKASMFPIPPPCKEREREEVLSFEVQKSQHANEKGWGLFPMVLPEGRSMALRKTQQDPWLVRDLCDRRIGPRGCAPFSSIPELFSWLHQPAGFSLRSASSLMHRASAFSLGMRPVSLTVCRNLFAALFAHSHPFWMHSWTSVSLSVYW